MKSKAEMPIGKTVVLVEVWNVIDQIPATLKRGIEYKATLLGIDVLSQDNKKKNELVAHWRIVATGERPRGGKTPLKNSSNVVELKLVK